MLLMQADTLRGQLGGSWKSQLFWTLWNGIKLLGEFHWGPKKVEISSVQPPSTCPSNGYVRIKSKLTGPYHQMSISSFMYISFYFLFCILYLYSVVYGVSFMYMSFQGPLLPQMALKWQYSIRTVTNFFRKFADIFAGQGAPLVSMTPVANPLVCHRCQRYPVLRIRDVYPGSRILIKEFKYFNPQKSKKNGF